MKPLVITLAALAVVTVALTAIWTSVSPFPCANSVVADVPSPDGLRRAVVFERDCGATTDFSAQVSVLGNGDELPDEGGNTFIAAGRGQSVSVLWPDSRELRVRYDRRDETFRKESAAGGVSVTYEPTS